MTFAILIDLMHSLFDFSTKVLSHFVGMLADIPVPQPLRAFVIGTFAKSIKADLKEAEASLESYRSCGDFFARALKPGLRPIAQSFVVSPVDGTVRSVSPAEQPIPQVKGETFALKDLLQIEPNVGSETDFSGGSVAVLYLAPHNYHRVHFPISGTVHSIKRIKGALWPVNNWGLANIRQLFCVNERIVLSGNSAHGPWALVMVGATNVGRMELAFAESQAQIQTGNWTVTQGQELGRFRLGSTVVLITSFALAAIEQERAVRYGESLL